MGPTRARIATEAAGWTAVALGAVHTVAAPYDVRAEWAQAVREGWWDTFTLEPATTYETAKRSEALWISMASFGVPVLSLGAYVVWSVHRGQRVPAWLGWTTLAWGVPFATAIPRSPAWAVPAIGALLVAGDRGRRGDG